MASEDKLLTLLSLSGPIHPAFCHLCVFILVPFRAHRAKADMTAALYQTLSFEKRLKLKTEGLDFGCMINVGFRCYCDPTTAAS